MVCAPTRPTPTCCAAWDCRSHRDHDVTSWIVGQPEVGNSDRECRSLSDNWRLGGVCALDRVQTITSDLRFSSELYPLECKCRPVLRETARRLGGRSSPTPPGRSRRSTIARRSPAHLPKSPYWRASKRLQHDEWQGSGWDQLELSFGFHEQASVHKCAANSCGASPPVSVCGPRGPDRCARRRLIGMCIAA